MIFAQSRQMLDDSVFAFEDIVATWFDAYFNEHHQQRNLQAVAGIENMNSQIEVTDQAESSISNIVTFSQSLSYDKSASDSKTAEALVLVPWKDVAYNTALANQLAKELPDSFANIGATIPVPVIVYPADGDDGGNNALYALAALVLIPVVVIVGYLACCKRSRRELGNRRNLSAWSGGKDHGVVDDNEVETTSSPKSRPSHPNQPTTAKMIRHDSDEDNDQQLPRFKDQVRTVEPPVPDDTVGVPSTVLVHASQVEEVGHGRRQDPPEDRGGGSPPVAAAIVVSDNELEFTVEKLSV